MQTHPNEFNQQSLHIFKEEKSIIRRESEFLYKCEDVKGLPSFRRVKGKDGGVRGSGRKVGGWGVVACAPSKAPQPPSDGQ